MDEQPGAQTSFEEVPLKREEYITTLIHFYRGEMSRANTWRIRLDTSTNWAVVATGAMLSLSFSSADHSHVTLLLTAVITSIFLGVEARRFRYFDVWRSRIRMVEENFLVPILKRDLVSPRSHWRDFVAHDLDVPTFKLSFLQALCVRLRRNYIWLYGVVLLAWLAKLNIHPDAAGSFREVVQRMAVGPLPGSAVGSFVLLFYLLLLLMAVLGRPRSQGGEVHGTERELEHWKG